MDWDKLGDDERIPVQDLKDGVKFLYDLIVEICMR